MLWLLILCFLVVVNAKPKEYEEDEHQDVCKQIKCVGTGYECINGECYCAIGYIPSPFQKKCFKCPGVGEKCYGPCCSPNTTLTCWQGLCQECYDPFGTWICREPLDHILLISSAQVAMATALVLGIVAVFMLLYKLCAVTTSLRLSGNSVYATGNKQHDDVGLCQSRGSRVSEENTRRSILLYHAQKQTSQKQLIFSPLGSSNSSYEGRLSIGSLQLYVEQRLRDAPPRYTRAAPPGTTAIPATVYVNSGFIHDCSVPPPPYTPAKDEDTRNSSLHI